MMVVTPGKAGEVWKAWFLRDRAGTAASDVTSVVGAERVTDLLALAGLAVLGLGVYGRASTTVAVVVGGLVGGVLVLQWRTLCHRVLSVGAEVPLIGKHMAAIGRFYESSYRLFRPRPLAIATLLSLLAWGLEGIGLWLVLRGLGVEATILVGLFVFGLGSVVGAASLLPGGLGATEATMVGVLVTVGYGSEVAGAATLLIRVGTLWYAALLGTLVFVGYQARR
jgi:uncharacterized protein (TIRG00374 family)